MLYSVEKSWKKKDGGDVAIINTAIVELVIINAEETLKWLSRNEDILQELLDELQNQVFTDYVGDKNKALSELKMKLINSLKNCGCKDKKVKELKNKILMDLSKISIKNID